MTHHKVANVNRQFHTKKISNSIFLVEFSGNIGRNGFLTSIASQKIFRPYFQKSRLEYYFLCLFYFSSPYSGHLRSDFVVLLLLLTARCRRTRKADQKCPEKQDKKSKRDMKNIFHCYGETKWKKLGRNLSCPMSILLFDLKKASFLGKRLF